MKAMKQEVLENMSVKELKQVRTYYKCNWMGLKGGGNPTNRIRQVEKELKRRRG